MNIIFNLFYVKKNHAIKTFIILLLFINIIIIGWSKTNDTMKDINNNILINQSYNNQIKNLEHHYQKLHSYAKSNKSGLLPINNNEVFGQYFVSAITEITKNAGGKLNIQNPAYLNLTKNITMAQADASINIENKNLYILLNAIEASNPLIFINDLKLNYTNDNNIHVKLNLVLYGINDGLNNEALAFLKKSGDE